MALDWSLLIATKDRLSPLRTSVRLALAQSCPPIEVIIVDASADWQAHHQAIQDEMADHPEIRLVYEPAPVPSLTVQRNLTLDHATAEIVFMIDDDAYMYPDCAETILQIYAADTDEEVVGIQGFPNPVSPEQSSESAALEARKSYTDVAPMMRSGGIKRWVLRNVFLLGRGQNFMPYDESGYREGPVPDTLSGFDVVPAILFGGYRMTYRRKVVDKERFEPLLRYYCPAEDLDASYRISRHGILLTARSARIHHHTSAAGRLNHYQVAHLRFLNFALFAIRNVKTAPQYLYRRYMRRRLLAETLKDILSRNPRFPRARGTWAAMRQARALFKMTPEEIENRYPVLQETIVRG